METDPRLSEPASEMQATIVGRCSGFIDDEPRCRRALAQIRCEHLSFSHQNIAFTFMA